MGRRHGEGNQVIVTQRLVRLAHVVTQRLVRLAHEEPDEFCVRHGVLHRTIRVSAVLMASTAFTCTSGRVFPRSLGVNSPSRLASQ